MYSNLEVPFFPIDNKRNLDGLARVSTSVSGQINSTPSSSKVLV